MFKRQVKRSGERIDTLIGAGTVILGDVRFTGGLHVDGNIRGDVDAPADSNATLSVSDGGHIEGSVNVPNVVLNGTVNGDIVGCERVELGATARVSGNVVYGLIQMAVGAQISGKLIHRPKNAGVVGSAQGPAAAPADQVRPS